MHLDSRYYDATNTTKILNFGLLENNPIQKQRATKAYTSLLKSMFFYIYKNLLPTSDMRNSYKYYYLRGETFWFVDISSATWQIKSNYGINMTTL